MKGRYRSIFFIIIGCLIVFSFVEIPTGFLKTKIYLFLAPADSLIMSVKIWPEDYTTFCADGFTPIIMDVSLYDADQNPVPYAPITIRPNNFTAECKPLHPVTDKDGRVVISIYPNVPTEKYEGYSSDRLSDVSVSIDLEAWKAVRFRWEGKMTHPPVLLIHGFQDSSESMMPLMNHLTKRGLMAYTMDYTTESDMEPMSDALHKAILNLHAVLKEKGIYAEKTDLIAHSLGGLVARYYTSKPTFIDNPNVRKMIFINVPHHGTPWAEAGAALLNAPFLKELYPTSTLYTSVFPNAINGGLNHNLQVANIALENDEVVPLPSAMLTSWNIQTKIYRIGSEPMNLENVISNQMGGSSRHRQILFYVPIFEEIFYYLTNSLSYPQERN